MLRPSKDNHTVIEQQPYSSPNVTKASDIFRITGDVEMVQHIIPKNKSGLQEFFSLNRKEDEFKYIHNKS